jgi:hypothetical protein
MQGTCYIKCLEREERYGKFNQLNLAKTRLIGDMITKHKMKLPKIFIFKVKFRRFVVIPVPFRSDSSFETFSEEQAYKIFRCRYKHLRNDGIFAFKYISAYTFNCIREIKETLGKFEPSFSHDYKSTMIETSKSISQIYLKSLENDQLRSMHR